MKYLAFVQNVIDKILYLNPLPPPPAPFPYSSYSPFVHDEHDMEHRTRNGTEWNGNGNGMEMETWNDRHKSKIDAATDSFHGEQTGHSGCCKRRARTARVGYGVPEGRCKGDAQLPQGWPRYGEGVGGSRHLSHVRFCFVFLSFWGFLVLRLWMLVVIFVDIVRVWCFGCFVLLQ